MRTQVGTISDVRFTNISATAEAGIVVAGCAASTIDGLVLDGVSLTLEQSTELPGKQPLMSILVPSPTPNEKSAL
jgi:hypothetical protein